MSKTLRRIWLYPVSALSAIIIIIIIIIIVKEFRDAIKLRYDWEITDTPVLYAFVVQFSVDQAMVCQRGGFIIQRQNVLHPREQNFHPAKCSMPWVPETFLAQFPVSKMCRPSANTGNSGRTREKPLVPRVNAPGYLTG